MSSTPLFKNYFNLSKKSLIILKLISISAGIVYGGHKLVQFVTPTEEELLKVKLL
jgi:heme O synthase-like polyprenyltransferase